MGIKDFGRVGVLMGGPSSEREISLKSGKAVFSALKEAGVEAVPIDITTDNLQENIALLKSYNLDCAFIALHGRFGEDGVIQGILEKLNLPFTASGVEASQLAMNKIGSLEIFSQGGLYVPKSQFIEKSAYEKSSAFTKSAAFTNQLGFPLVVKPANHGSSIGLSLVERIQELPAAIQLAFKFDERIIIQEYISGRELTVGILDEVALPVIEIIPNNKFFDFAAKYQAGLTQYIVPAALDQGVTLEVQKVALQGHKLLGCYGCSRVDIILTKDGCPYILEVNNIPGMTATSLLPKAAKIVGIDFSQLCLKLLELAYEKTKV
ncbi:MAG: D-alanine--D-alanine ligase [Candidatus Omnitrophota bacterium]|nr:D-alanine--D-alanine ligase [Candidatus Omnitrophota bacterium]